METDSLEWGAWAGAQAWSLEPGTDSLGLDHRWGAQTHGTGMEAWNMGTWNIAWSWDWILSLGTRWK
jgi:hypothetical protein